MKLGTNKPLRFIFIRLILHLLHLNLHSILGENDMLALHLRPRVLAHVLHDRVHDVSDGGEDGEEDDEEDEGDDVGGFGLGHYFVFGVVLTEGVEGGGFEVDATRSE